ncbi:hypothetical protein Plhal304r1_c077g0164011 [Plasmopara halstedii]
MQCHREIIASVWPVAYEQDVIQEAQLDNLLLRELRWPWLNSTRLSASWSRLNLLALLVWSPYTPLYADLMLKPRDKQEPGSRSAREFNPTVYHLSELPPVL